MTVMLIHAFILISFSLFGLSSFGANTPGCLDTNSLYRCAMLAKAGKCYVVENEGSVFAVTKEAPCKTGRGVSGKITPYVAPIPKQVSEDYNTLVKPYLFFKPSENQSEFFPIAEKGKSFDVVAFTKKVDGTTEATTATATITQADKKKVNLKVDKPENLGVIGKKTTTKDKVVQKEMSPPTPGENNSCTITNFTKGDHVFENQTKCELMYEEGYLQKCILMNLCKPSCDAETCVRQYYKRKNYNLAHYKAVSTAREQLQKSFGKKNIDYYSLCKEKLKEDNVKNSITGAAADLVKEASNSNLAKNYCSAVWVLDDRVRAQMRDPVKDPDYPTDCVAEKIYNFHEDIQYLYQVFEARRVNCSQNFTCNGGRCEDETLKAGRNLPSGKVD